MAENLFIFFVFITIFILPILCFNPRFPRYVSHSGMYSSTLRIDSVEVAVKDWKKSVSFYQELLELNNKNELDSTAIFSLKDGSAFRILQSSIADSYEIGEGFNGIGISRMQPVEVLPRVLKSPGATLIRDFGDYKLGACLIPDEDDMKQTPVRYFTVSDPNGYRIEVQEGDVAQDKIVLAVVDLDESIDFYTNILGMNIFRKRSNINNFPKDASMCAYVGFGRSEGDGLFIELLYNYGTEDSIDLGEGFQKLVLSTTSLPEVIARLALKAQAFSVNDDGSISVVDPNGYQIEIIGK